MTTTPIEALIKVNKANLVELKNACDDAVREVRSPSHPIPSHRVTPPPPTPTHHLTLFLFSCPQYFTRPTAFTQSHVHQSVRLILGWSAALIAFAAAYYGYTVPFEESKFLVGVGVVVYVPSFQYRGVLVVGAGGCRSPSGARKEQDGGTTNEGSERIGSNCCSTLF